MADQDYFVVCNHSDRCSLEKGHDGLHFHLGDSVETWNDGGETAIPDVGRAFPCPYSEGRQERNKILSLVILDAKKSLSKGTVFEVRAKPYPIKDGAFSDFGTKRLTYDDQSNDWGIAWYLVPKQPVGFEHLETPTSPLFTCDVDSGEATPFGYVILARIEV